MYAPHPGLVHYEMAAAGMIVVTNEYDYRDKEYFAVRSKNFIATQPTIHDLALALKTGAARANDFKGRLEHAYKPAVTSWEEVFSDSFVLGLLKRIGI
ncbi:MAG: hypothetical protein CUN55_19185 [Phototrophicales bacterium]|nr:MAG: hypothetical protein CUN55_19185 [Phototrophicales bacterium]